MQLPAHQDGFQNRDKVYYLLTIIIHDGEKRL